MEVWFSKSTWGELSAVVVGAHKKVSEVDEVERVVVIVVCALVVDVEREVVGTGVELEVV